MPEKPAKHIGIVACSAEGAALCYRTICIEGAALLGKAHAHPEVSLHAHSLADYEACLESGDLAGVGALMLDSAQKLAKTGADFLICPDNTIHAAYAHVAPRSALPWLHIAEVVAQEALARGYRKLALTGTQWLVDSTVYPDVLAAQDIDSVKPDSDECREINRIIMSELVEGVFKAESIARLTSIIARLKRDDHCDAVILGCTELPLAIDEVNSPLPILDSTRLLARAALKRAVDTSR